MLSGRTVIIVEAQYLIAFDLQNTLEDLGSSKVVIARDAAHALVVLATLTNCDIAILEIERELGDHIALAAELVRRGIHVIGLTADAELPGNLAWFPGTPILIKPVPTDRVLAAVTEFLKLQNE